MESFSSSGEKREVSSSSTEEPSRCEKSGVHGVSSRLLQQTASSSARTGNTPTLRRKFGPKTPTTNVVDRRRNSPQTSGPQKKVLSSTVKKPVLNSTASSQLEENVLPTDWDASAIAAPHLPDGSVAKKTPPSLDSIKEIKFRTAVKTIKRGPLKALPSQMKPLKPYDHDKNTFIRGPTRSLVGKLMLSSQSSSDSSRSEDSQAKAEYDALYDEYLLSELILCNVKKNCHGAKQQMNKEVMDLWSGLERLRTQVLEKERLLLELKQLNQFATVAKTNNEHIDMLIEELPSLAKNVRALAGSLETTRNHLPVVGATADSDRVSHVLKCNMDQLIRAAEKAGNSNVQHDIMNAEVTKLNDNLRKTSDTFQRVLLLTDELNTLKLKETSLKISEIQAGHKSNLDTLCQLKMPPKVPEPKLIDI